MADKLKAALKSLGSPPVKRRGPYLMQIFRVGFVDRLLIECWDDAKSELSLNDRSFDDICDWCTVEAFSRAFASQSVTVAGHYRHDEARCVYEAHMQRAEDHIRTLVNNSVLRYWVDCEIKITILGPEIIIARPSPTTKF